MAYKNGFLLFDDEFINQHWTPEEIAEAKANAAEVTRIIKDEQAGLITHDEAVIRFYVHDFDAAYNDLEDAINDGNIETVREVWERMQEAKSRITALPEAVNA